MKTFEIKQCALDLGEVYELVLLEDGVNAGGRVVSGGVGDYCEALDEGEAWVSAVGELVDARVDPLIPRCY